MFSPDAVKRNTLHPCSAEIYDLARDSYLHKGYNMPIDWSDCKTVLMPSQHLLKKLDPSGSLNVTQLLEKLRPLVSDFERLVPKTRSNQNNYNSQYTITHSITAEHKLQFNTYKITNSIKQLSAVNHFASLINPENSIF